MAGQPEQEGQGKEMTILGSGVIAILLFAMGFVLIVQGGILAGLVVLLAALVLLLLVIKSAISVDRKD